MIKDTICQSLYFGVLVSLGAYLFGIWLREKTGFAVFNPLLVAIVAVIAILSFFHIDYDDYNVGGSFVSFLLTPATVCLAIPLYKQLELLKREALAVFAAITAGVAGSAASIFAMCALFKMSHAHYVTLLPKSITTAIGMGVSEEAGGIVTLTVASIIVTGILGNIAAEFIFRLAKLEEPIAKGLALGTAAHAIGTAKALSLGEIEGAMSSLAIAVAGIMAVVVVPLVSGLI